MLRKKTINQCILNLYNYNNNMKKLSLFIPTILLVAVFACKNDDPAPTRQELIIGKWMLTAQVTTASDGEITDDFPTKPACEKDNTFEFAQNGNYTIDEGATKCSLDDPQQTTDAWSISSNGEILTITALSGPLEGQGLPLPIVELTNTQLKVSILFDFGTSSETTVYTYTKI